MVGVVVLYGTTLACREKSLAYYRASQESLDIDRSECAVSQVIPFETFRTTSGFCDLIHFRMHAKFLRSETTCEHDFLDEVAVLTAISEKILPSYKPSFSRPVLIELLLFGCPFLLSLFVNRGFLEVHG